jgi:hypothetical protein
VQRQCARPGCAAVATATFTFDARQCTIWLDTPHDSSARAGELCERHVRALRPPQGWELDDRRHSHETSGAPVEVPGPVVERIFGPTEEVRLLRNAHSPLLARAFRNAGAM